MQRGQERDGPHIWCGAWRQGIGQLRNRRSMVLQQGAQQGTRWRITAQKRLSEQVKFH
jgi:hypothetical protein